MGVVNNVSTYHYPKQSANVGKRVEVMFRYSNIVLTGRIVRDDAEPPLETIFHLDDGRYILDSECQYRVIEEVHP